MNRIGSLATRMVAFVAAIGMVCALMPTAALADSGRIVTLGANLNDQERATVLNFFGLTEADLKNLSVVTVTNEDERAHLASSVDIAVIGDKTYSCSYIQPTTSGGIYVQTANLTYVTNYMLYNALQTAGVKNCNLVVTAPYPVSGTGALTGVFMAYESQGQQLDEAKEEVATQELVTTAQLTETYGDGVAEVISDVKDQVISNEQILTDEQIRQVVQGVAASQGLRLTDADLDRIMQLVSHLQQLGYDASAFDVTLSDFESKLQEVTQKAQEAGGVLDAIGNFFQGIIDWFKGLFGGNVPSVEDVSQSAQDFFSGFNTDVFQWDGAQQ
ncbi:MAG: DUF1002 domain-containing protein [Atopobiaceae bacterium]|nr:DUF1002 domain-containing protein [Atopobiaceae bacterium]